MYLGNGIRCNPAFSSKMDFYETSQEPGSFENLRKTNRQVDHHPHLATTLQTPNSPTLQFYHHTVMVPTSIFMMIYPKDKAIDVSSTYNDVDIAHWGNDRLVKELSVKRFKEKLSGRGILVKKVKSGKAEFIPRRMRYMGKHIYISSMKGGSVIAIDDIHICVADGKVLTIETGKGVETRIMMPSRTDALAIRNVLGKGIVF